LAAQHPWTSTYGWARTLLATGTILTLLLNHTDILFRTGSGLTERVFCGAVSFMSLFCLVPVEHLEVARYVAIAGLLVVISGWRPRFTGLIHFYVSYSLHATALIVDGGDQVTTVLTLLLLPVTLTDPRRSHWQTGQSAESGYLWRQVSAWVAITALFTIRVQIAIIYLVAATAKMAVPEWVDGTALYYWLSSPYIGIPRDTFVWSLLEPALSSGFVALITWSALLLELLLAGALFSSQPYRRWLFYPGIAFHIAIALLMGITSFSIAMCGALILHLWPAGRQRVRSDRPNEEVSAPGRAQEGTWIAVSVRAGDGQEAE